MDPPPVIPRPVPNEWRLHRYATIRKSYRARSNIAAARAQKPHWKAKNATRGIHRVDRDPAWSKIEPPPAK